MKQTSEEWRPVKGYEGKYEVSNLGRVRSCDRSYQQKGRWGMMTINRKGKMLVPQLSNGYERVLLSEHQRTKNEFVHRLVAMAFVPNPDNKPFINHKDENRRNNVPDNLEWVTTAENNLYGSHVERTQSANIVNRRKIQQIKDGVVVATFESVTDAHRKTGIPISSISQSLNGKLSHTHGYQFVEIE